MIEIKVLPSGNQWTWKLRQKGECWTGRRVKVRANKAAVRLSAQNMADMLRAEGCKVHLDLGVIPAYECGHGIEVVANCIS